MSTEDNRAIVRRYIEGLWNQGDLAVADQILTPDYAAHDPGTPGRGERPGPAGEQQVVQMYRTVFPDLYFTVEDQITEGDKVVVRWISHGTHRGELLGLAPTGRQTRVTGITILCLASGKIAENWSNWDALGLLQQVGAIPAPEQAGR